VSLDIEPLIRDLQRRSSPTSGSLDNRAGQTGFGDVARAIGPHLNNWICSAVNRIFDFAELVKDTIPIDPVRAWPPGQMLEGVKLQRARGGCLGAKSR
jgi:hypothetical protein